MYSTPNPFICRNSCNNPQYKMTVFATINGSPWQKFYDRHCYSLAYNYLNVVKQVIEYPDFHSVRRGQMFF